MQICTGRGYAIQELIVEQEPAEGETRAIQLQLIGRRGSKRW
ncbi:MAG TPA: hypothetical protein VMH77_05140 [Steroidobacteraceae bacterium]|nr:hypothetical protein [Steroidobacteraceae bacterium]